MAHILYVKTVSKSDNDQVSRKITYDVLKYINSRLYILLKMGLIIKVVKVSKKSLKNQKLLIAMSECKLDRLPALVTSANTYIGLDAIIKVYEDNIISFKRNDPSFTDEPPHISEGNIDPDDELTKYYSDELSNVDDGEESIIGESDSFRSIAQNKNEKTSEESSRKSPSENTTPRHREDNINYLSREVDDTTKNLAFSRGNEDDDENTSQDDYLEKAYWGSHVADSEFLTD